MTMLAAKLIFAAGMALPLLAQTASEQIASHARAAHEAEKQNDFATAVLEYEYLTRQLPRSAEMQSNLGVALYFDHAWTRAISAFRKAVTLNPSLLAPHLFSGLAWYQLSLPDAAVPELEKAVHIGSSDVLAHTWLGYAYVAQSHYEAAVREFQIACHLAPANIDAWYALGQSYLQIGKDATRELLTIAPDGGRVWQLAGEQFQMKGDRKKALEDFEAASERRPDIAELPALVTEMGGAVTATSSVPHGEDRKEDDLYRQAHDAEEKSRAAFEHVVQIAPNSYRAHQIMADVFVAEQRFDEAVQEYRIVLEEKPDLPGVHEAIGNSLVQQGKLPDALNEFQSEVKLQPRSSIANMNTGRVLLMMGDDDRAGTMLATALQMDRPPLEIYFLLGKLDLRRKDYRAAIDALTQYLSTEKDASSAYYLLVRAYRGLGDKEHMNQALDLYKKTSQDAKQRGSLQRDLGLSSDKTQIPEETAD